MYDLLRNLIITGLIVAIGLIMWHVHSLERYVYSMAAYLDSTMSLVDNETETPRAGGVNTVGGLTYYLYGSGVASSDSTITLTYFYIPVSKQKLQMTDFGSVGYLTLEPGNTTKQEFVSFTGVTQNSDGTATLTGVARGLSPITPYAASTTLQKAHAGGTQAVISNPPQLYQNFLTLSNNATSSAILTFGSTTPPRYDNVGAQSTGTYIATTSELVSWAGLAAVTNAGTVNSTEAVKGIVELGTAREAASSTALGGTGASLVLQTKHATDTPQNCSTASTGGCIVMTLLNGKINQSFFDLTQAWSFAASSIAKLTLNSLAYVFPTTRTASSTALMDDGAGNLSWEYPHADTIDIAGSAYITSATASTSVKWITIPAGRLSSTTVVRIKASGMTKFSTGQAPMVEIQFGSGASTSSVAFFAPNSGCSSNGCAFNFDSSIFTTGVNTQTTLTTVASSTFNGLPPGAGGNQVANLLAGQQYTTTTFTASNQLYINIVENAGNGSNEARYYGITAEIVTK